jgi:hypothetical protein
MTISATSRMTSKQKADLNKMNVASQRAGGLGDRLDAMQYDGIPAPAAGTVVGLRPIKYTTTPVVGDNVRTHAAVLLTTGVQQISTAITNPDYPRNLTIKGNDGNVAGNVVITGTDVLNAALTETIALNGASAVVGTKAFRTVTNIQLPVYNTAGTESVSVGVGVKIGFPVRIYNINQKLYTNFDGAIDAGTVTVGAGVAFSLYAVAGTMDGAKVLEMAFTA